MPYNTTLTVTEGTRYTWTVDSGTCPAGLTLGAGTGVLSGTRPWRAHQPP